MAGAVTEAVGGLAQAATATIEAQDLHKAYPGGVKAVDGVSFAVGRGEIFGLLGPNGAGKSTTVRMLATLTRPDGGGARVAGHDVVRHAGAVRRTIGYVSQQSGVDREATGRENLTLQGHLYHMARPRLRRRVDELLAMLGLEQAANRLARGYSGGMKRRLDIAMGLVHEPEVLFLDEPTTGLDPESRAALWHDLTELRDRSGLSILLTTHYLEEADALAERVAIVDHGRIVATGSPAELKGGLRGDTVELELPDAKAARTAQAVAAAVGGVVEATSHQSRLHVLAADGPSALPALVAALQEAGIEVRAATVARPSLDEVYLHHTGRAFAQAEAEAAVHDEGGRGW
jgi:ABC-2 type transport system ATP-binding protein